MTDESIKKEDYVEPTCPLCMKDPSKKEVKRVDISRVIEKLDSFFEYNDTNGAKRHLEYWLREAEYGNDDRGKFTILNELMGLCRKMRLKDEAVNYANQALCLGEMLEMGKTISYGTTLLNSATVFKAFGESEKALSLYEKALENYRENLSENDTKFAGLYNNMGLALVDLKKYDKAITCYDKAVAIMSVAEKGKLDCAISYLNKANAVEAKDGLLDGEEVISQCLDKAEALILDESNPRDGYFAFVCDKCAPTFGYYGRFFVQNTLDSESKRIYKENSEKR